MTSSRGRSRAHWSWPRWPPQPCSPAPRRPGPMSKSTPTTLPAARRSW